MISSACLEESLIFTITMFPVLSSFQLWWISRFLNHNLKLVKWENALNSQKTTLKKFPKIWWIKFFVARAHWSCHFVLFRKTRLEQQFGHTRTQTHKICFRQILGCVATGHTAWVTVSERYRWSVPGAAPATRLRGSGNWRWREFWRARSNFVQKISKSPKTENNLSKFEFFHKFLVKNNGWEPFLFDCQGSLNPEAPEKPIEKASKIRYLAYSIRVISVR